MRLDRLARAVLRCGVVAEVRYTVDVDRCIRCGACAIVAPAIFAVSRRVALRRQPSSDEEVAACAVAALVCPTQAIAEAS